MNRKLNYINALLTISALVSPLALAQAPVQKNAANTAPVASKLKSNAAGADKLMSRDELRACMKLKESNIARTTEIEQRNEQNRKEKQELLQAPDNAQAVRANVELRLEAVKQADALVREHGKAVEDWNERMAEFEKKSKDMRNERQRRQTMKDERYELKAKDEKLISDRAEKIAAYERAVTEANEKINQRAKLNEAWNKRNQELADDEDKLVEARDKWMTECSRRRYLEDDEKLIKAGK